MPDLQFFWDPVCPWAWLTSQWVREVQARRGIEVEWSLISLRILNEGRIDYERDQFHDKAHGLGLRLLRVAQATRAAGHADQLGALYRALGTRIHVERDGVSMFEAAVVADTLLALGLDPSLACAADQAEHDAAIRAETEEALSRVGDDVGTPVLTFRPPDGPSFFGPVIAKAPRGADAERLWDLVSALADWPGFAELKRSARGERHIV